MALPATLCYETYVLHGQYRERATTCKNYRYFLHVSLLCQTVAYIGRCADMATISFDNNVNIDVLQISEESYCDWSGSLQILFETFGYILLATYLYLLRSSVTNATADLKCLRVKLQVFAFSTTFAAWLLIMKGPKLGLESTLTCGVQFSANFTEYTELCRNWHILLVPYLLWKSLKLTESVPGFIKRSFSYIALQVMFYVTVFAIRMSISFAL